MISCPASTGSGESDLVSERLAAGFTVVSALAELLATLRSVTSDDTLAWLVIWPVACGSTLISTVASLPEESAPRSQVTVPVDCWHVPWDGVADWNVTFGGSVSVTCACPAAEGPALWTASV